MTWGPRSRLIKFVVGKTSEVEYRHGGASVRGALQRGGKCCAFVAHMGFSVAKLSLRTCSVAQND